jgi:hypothetical protein
MTLEGQAAGLRAKKTERPDFRPAARAKLFAKLLMSREANKVGRDCSRLGLITSGLPSSRPSSSFSSSSSPWQPSFDEG